MGRTKQEFTAATMGHQFTMYAACRALGIPLSKEQEEFQEYLESKYPAVVDTKEVPSNEDS